MYHVNCWFTCDVHVVTLYAGAAYNLDGYSKAQGIFGVFNALGTVAFAYGGHNVILEIQVC